MKQKADDTNKALAEIQQAFFHRTVQRLCLPYPHGPGSGTPPAGCRASGENKEKAKEKTYFLSRRFFVFIVPVNGVSALSLDGMSQQKRNRQ